MNNEELTAKITQLEAEIVKLRGIIYAGRTPTRQRITDRTEFVGDARFKRIYCKDVDDISLTAIGDTSSTNQSSNITANFNAIINALTNQ